MKGIGFHETETGVYEEFFKNVKNAEGISFPVNRKLTELMKKYNEQFKKPQVKLDEFTHESFKAVPHLMALKEKFVTFCQNTDDQTLKDLAYQSYMVKVIAECYLNVPKEQRTNRFFNTLQDMERNR
jgi:hypothetical protein